MTDLTLDRYLTWGTAADRAAFTPSPGVGGTGTNILPIWIDSDVAGNPAWFWDTGSAAWVALGAGGITELTGDVTAGPGSGSQAATVANVDYTATLTATGTPPTNAVGYLGAPQNILAGSYTTVMTDAGKHFYHTSATPHTLTIDSNANVAFPVGTVMAGVNESGAGALTIAITSDTLRWGSSTGSRTVAANGSFSLLKVASTVWRLTGDGIT